MYSAIDAKNAVKDYYEEQKIKEQKEIKVCLSNILCNIKNNAEAGLDCYITDTKKSLFKTQNCEEQAVEQLIKLGFKVDNSGPKVIITWRE